MGILWDPEVVEQKQVTLREPPGNLDLALKNTNDMLRQWELRGYGQWSVIEKMTGHVMGCVGFYHPQTQWPGVDLGWIIHRSRWGHGLATEAATAALGWVWEYTQIDRIVSLIAPDDLRSIRIATKIGERFERADVDPVHANPCMSTRSLALDLRHCGMRASSGPFLCRAARRRRRLNGGRSLLNHTATTDITITARSSTRSS